MVSLPAASVARLAGAQAFGDGEGEGAGDGEAAAGLGLASGLAAMLAGRAGGGGGRGGRCARAGGHERAGQRKCHREADWCSHGTQTLLRDGTGESVPEPRTSPGFVAGEGLG